MKAEKKVRAFPEVFTEEEVAEFLNLSRATMQKNRCLGLSHPPFKKLGARIVYPVDEFYRWWNSIPLNRELAHGGKEKTQSSL